ncbi:protein of unknown function [Xenorhabdus doucetiae]|uniref:Uncharacterized protein n=1 Tax=Xenorhabdus doucetiae TaxID=351671 RepID=A0A068QQP8_9GAMM|nr:hypothetical protein LY16_00136 [Xenorhabdus doucetiae]CDG17357.1 protein of unknown function [Xenorhabdus doucetiae]
MRCMSKDRKITNGPRLLEQIVEHTIVPISRIANKWGRPRDNSIPVISNPVHLSLHQSM